MSDLDTIRGERVTLRPWRSGDAAALSRAIQDPEIVRWLGIEVPYTIDDARRFIDRAADQWDRRQGAHFVIADLENSDPLGYLGVLAVEPDMAVVEIVYWVAADARGRGVATAALADVLPWIAEAIAPERIELGMVGGNTASAAVAEACGFVLHEVVPGGGTLDGKPGDERIYRWRPAGARRRSSSGTEAPTDGRNVSQGSDTV